MRRVLSVLLTVMLLTVSIPAFAENARTSGLYTYSIKGNGTITITDFDWQGNGGEDVFIPVMIDGYTVAGIGDNAFKDGEEEVCVTLPDTITTIGQFAFMDSAVTSLNIPDSVQSIGIGAFAGCTIDFKLSGTHPHFAVIEAGESDEYLYNKARKELIAAPSSISTDCVIPEGIVSIGDYAFYKCYLYGRIYSEYNKSFMFGTPQIQLPQTLTSIGDYAFYATLTSPNYQWLILEIPSSVTHIGTYAFGGNGNRIMVDLKETSLTAIPDYAFYRETQGCCVEISNPQNIESIGKYAGCGDVFDSVDDFSEKITVIPTGLNPWVKELPDTIVAIESKAFEKKVTDFKLSSHLTKIADDAFVEGSTFIVESGTYAELWAKENGFEYSVEGQSDFDWLNS